mmetsp:Transcript_26253/g.42100  ORF Transcript_26253/g.42100 Transcript_26253/m.42100 type:complete len:111 (-) Transcript_26253:506-838(-)
MDFFAEALNVLGIEPPITTTLHGSDLAANIGDEGTDAADGSGGMRAILRGVPGFWGILEGEDGDDVALKEMDVNTGDMRGSGDSTFERHSPGGGGSESQGGKRRRIAGLK